MGGPEIDLGGGGANRREVPHVEEKTSPSAGEVRGQIERILDSIEFKVPDRTRKFLKYVIDESLAGHANRIKAYSIAIEVFGRGESFDAQQDPVVRTEAARLRQALERYYLVAGQSDPVIVSIPKGGYVPAFERRPLQAPERRGSAAASFPPGQNPDRRRLTRGLLSAAIVLIAILAGWIAAMEFNRGGSTAGEEKTAAPASGSVAPRGIAVPDVPRVRVDLFSASGDSRQTQDMAIGLNAEIVHQLSRFKNLIVVSGQHPSAPATRSPPPDYLVSGNVQAMGTKVQIWVQLLDGKDGSIVWSQLYDQDLTVGGLVDAQVDVARNVAIALGQPSGMVTKSAAAAERQSPDDLVAYTCVLSYYTYRIDFNPARHAEVRACLEQAVARLPDYARAWALLSLVYLDEDRFEYNFRADAAPPIRRAIDAAERAVKLDPQNATALSALMNARFLNKDVAGGKDAGERALALNPNDMDLVADYGNRLILSGDRKRGTEMIEYALASDYANGNIYYPMLAAAYYFNRDPVKAAALMDKTWVKQNPIVLMCAVAIYARVGRMDDADRARREFLALGTSHLRELEEAMAKRNLSVSDRAYFVEGLVKGGLPVPAAIVARYAGKA